MLWEIRLRFEKNEIIHFLFPDLVPDISRANRWNNSEILVNRTEDWSEATIETIGVGGKLTSRHFPVHIKDDIVDDEVAQSAIMMQHTKDWLAYSESIFVNPGQDTEYIVGTRYALNDPYGDIMNEIVKSPSDIPDWYGTDFLSNGYLVHMRSAVEAGKCTVPEILDELTLKRIKTRQGKRIYCSQYLNYPFHSDAKAFNKDWLKYYTFDDVGNVLLTGEDGKTYIIPIETLSITMRIDPSTGESVTTRDRSAIVVDGVDSKGRIIVLVAWAKKCKMSELFAQIVKMYRRWHPHKVGFEAIAGFKVLVPELKSYCRREQVSPYIVPLTPIRGASKETRICAYDERFRAGDVHIQASMTDFITEFENYPDPSVPDDLLDAFAYGDQVWITPIDEEAEREWDEEEAQILMFRKRSRTGY